VQVLGEGQEAPKGCGVYVVNEAITVSLDLEGIVDPQKEAEKLKAKQVDFIDCPLPLPTALCCLSCFIKMQDCLALLADVLKVLGP